MRSVIGRAFTLVLLFAAGPAWAAGDSATRFDLVCSGDAVSQGLGEVKTFAGRLSIDTAKRVFCEQNACAKLDVADAKTLSYRCQAVNGGRFCGPLPDSTAGPFVWHDEFAFDRATGAFTRKSWGSVGDIASRHFTLELTGKCKVAPPEGA